MVEVEDDAEAHVYLVQTMKLPPRCTTAVQVKIEGEDEDGSTHSVEQDALRAEFQVDDTVLEPGRDRMGYVFIANHKGFTKTLLQGKWKPSPLS